LTRVKLSVKFSGLVNHLWANEKSEFFIIGKFNKTAWLLVWYRIIAAGIFIVSEELTIFSEFQLINTTDKLLTLELAITDYEVAL
jgi:hypothetical protein